jgi:hypothetical protein
MSGTKNPEALGQVSGSRLESSLQKSGLHNFYTKEFGKVQVLPLPADQANRLDVRKPIRLVQEGRDGLDLVQLAHDDKVLDQYSTWLTGATKWIQFC